MSPDSGPANPTFDLLCAMVAPTPDLDRLRRDLRAGVDFKGLFELACDHSVRPQLIRTLAALAWEAVPAAMRSDLDAFQRVHGGFCLAAADQLGCIVTALAAQGIRVATFKGATTALALYGDLTAREYNDIDLLVPHAQLDRAEDVLVSLGYRAPQGDRHFRRAFLAHQRQYSFFHADRATVDLHWALTANHLPFPLDPEEIWATLSEVPLGRHTVRAVTGADLALLLAGHGAKERWLSLGWVCDFAWLADRRRDLDWRALHQRARERRCGDSLLLACVMADRLLGVPVPAAVASVVAARARVDALATRLAGGLRQARPAPGRTPDLNDLDLCDRPVDRAAAMLRIALTPTAGDHAALPLPPALWPLYWLTRPVRLSLRAAGLR